MHTTDSLTHTSPPASRREGSLKVLNPSQWQEQRQRHQQRVDSLTEAHQRRRARGERHPVWDFLFTYYPATPGKLKKWHPGLGTGLEIPSGGAADLPRFKDAYAAVDDVWALDLGTYLKHRGNTVTFIRDLLQATCERPVVLSCFGLHEWAMVYRDDKRHPEGLRLGVEGTNEVVEQHSIRCTHYDAFRFFTPAAAPLNSQQLQRSDQIRYEQPGCLHAGMDLYKWATKLGPLVPGGLWLDCFELARDLRQLDMEASPYDLRDWGFDPVRIETAEGKAEYVQRQRMLSERGQLLRGRLLEVLHLALGAPH